MNQKSDEHALTPDGNGPALDSPAASTLTRREFLRLAAITSVGLVLAACAPTATPTPPPAAAAPTRAATTAPTTAPTAPAVTRGTTLNMLQWSHFAPPGDEYFDKWAADWGKKNGIEVKVEHINANDIAARLASHVQAKSGPDIIQYMYTWPAIYSESLVDVSDVADKLGKQLGGWYKDAETYSKVDGVWRTVPFSLYGNNLNYRGDWFKEAGLTPPKTLDEFLALAKKLKQVGHPFGQALGHSFTDPRVFWYGWLWSWGGREVSEDGKTVTLDSPATLLAVEKALELYDAMVPGTLSWDDSNNNRAFLAGDIGATMNAASIYLSAIREGQTRLDLKKTNPQVAVPADIEHAVMPGGPGGNLWLQQCLTNGIMSWSKNVGGAKDFIFAMMQPEVYTQYLTVVNGYNVGPLRFYDDAPIWKTDPKILPFRETFTNGSNRWAGFPGPASRNAGLVLEDFTIIDLFAKACSKELTPKQSIDAAVTRLKRFYR